MGKLSPAQIAKLAILRKMSGAKPNPMAPALPSMPMLPHLAKIPGGAAMPALHQGLSTPPVMNPMIFNALRAKLGM